jgi:predicted nucleic acid-binding protein
MSPTKRPAAKRPDGRRGKVRKEFWLDPRALRRAQAALGAATERETVELALDIVAFRDEVQAGVRALDGLALDRRAWVPKYALDANCFIDASRGADALAALGQFAAWAAPGLYLSSVVAAELRAGARSARDRKALEDQVLGPFVRRGRVLTPSPAAWDALGRTLAVLREREGLQLAQVPRSFVFDILLAYSCREGGVTLVTANARDMARIHRVFAFNHVGPYPSAP